jgi:hypothetical protein
MPSCSEVDCISFFLVDHGRGSLYLAGMLFARIRSDRMTKNGSTNVKASKG